MKTDIKILTKQLRCVPTTYYNNGIMTSYDVFHGSRFAVGADHPFDAFDCLPMAGISTFGAPAIYSIFHPATWKQFGATDWTFPSQTEVSSFWQQSPTHKIKDKSPVDLVSKSN